ncbi:hypothetical protein FACS189452_10410 [Bacteroidia bacterium]|nr:hypothetical protein FACS189452_10410 [Bacteroidia bacterium]GHT80176.1 hypothetical protein FACS189467_1650 [Bacteroidia bacterium]
MKKILKTFALLLAVTALVGSCENYTDEEIGYTPVFAVSGEWRIRVTDFDADTLVTTTMYTFGTYNTADNSTSEIWIRTTSSMAGGLGALRGKISCGLSDLTFGATNANDISVAAGATFSITEGKITKDALSMPSGVKADKISFKYTTSKKPGKTYLFEGYRRTMWPEDDSFRTF